jgi:hypothetical protein
MAQQAQVQVKLRVLVEGADSLAQRFKRDLQLRRVAHLPIQLPPREAVRQPSYLGEQQRRLRHIAVSLLKRRERQLSDAQQSSPVISRVKLINIGYRRGPG